MENFTQTDVMEFHISITNGLGEKDISKWINRSKIFMTIIGKTFVRSAKKISRHGSSRERGIALFIVRKPPHGESGSKGTARHKRLVSV
mmetsp:Transcript_106816/g.212113  ORF Transcript_106816/g.212113 Transcript_106816/m.212113 type:complete len:89 (+) Transcript_106816:223-489(+)